MTGALGVSLTKSGRYHAEIKVAGGRVFHLGTYDTLEEASVVRDSAAWHVAFEVSRLRPTLNHPYFHHTNPPPLLPRIRELRDRLCREGLINL